jgi:hypothetical protein
LSVQVVDQVDAQRQQQTLRSLVLVVAVLRLFSF